MKGTRVVRVAAALCALVLVSAPASAQVDLTGVWASRLHEDYIDRGPGSDLVDYTGVPLNDEARAKALRYDPSVYSMIERQCLYNPPQAASFLPQGLWIWSEVDAGGRVSALRISGSPERAGWTIWMDGRPHPSANAVDTFSGFTTGQWEGTTLTTYTTHLKEGYTRRGNGIPASDQATVVSHFTRHDNLLTIVTIQEDPVYLTEPFVVSRTWQLDPGGNQQAFTPCFSGSEVPRFEDSGIVPHYLPGANRNLSFMSDTYHVPQDAALGHAETTYPEYRKKMKDSYQIPAACTRYCCGWIEAQGRPQAAPNLSCTTGGKPLSTPQPASKPAAR